LLLLRLLLLPLLWLPLLMLLQLSSQVQPRLLLLRHHWLPPQR
jgi:hypothetical protein